MFERYTEKARRVIFFARQEAVELGGQAIEPHHILLALIREDRPLITRFANLSLPALDDIRERIQATIGSSQRLAASVDMPLSHQAKLVLSYAADESEQLKYRYLSTEHLLLGLLRVEQAPALEILIECGIDINTVRNELRDGATGELPSSAGSIKEMRRLAAEARNLASALAYKAERIEAICDQLAVSSDDKESDSR